MKIHPIFVCLFILFSSAIHAQDSALSAEQRLADFDLEKGGLAVHGYDPVSYFENGPQKGSKSITTTFKGVTYRFSSEENKQKFIADPSKYEPAYGGWCAWAMLDGDKTEPDPKTYKIVDGRLFLYYNGFFGNTLKMWNEKAAKESGDAPLATKADTEWAKIVKDNG